MTLRFCALAAILAACSGSPTGPASFAGLSAITLRGHASLSDGSPAGGKQLEVRFLGNGDGLFPAGVHHCSEGDDHAQALQVVNVVTDRDGGFFVSAPIDGFVRATDEKCTMSRRAARHLASLDVKVQLDADPASCIAYCGDRGGACVADCIQQGQKFVWTTSMTSRDLGGRFDVRLDELGPPLPPDDDAADLEVDGAAAASSLEIDHEDFTADSCEVQDQCIAAPGTRTLLRFDGVVENLGLGDLVLGSPENNPLFVYSECHGHYHLKDFLRAELLDADGAIVTRGGGQVVSQKQGFCIKDVDQVAGSAPSKYDCQDQGLTSGWADLYSRDLGCQWIDVTGVAPGKYTLRLTVNPGGTLPEGNLGNNSALIPVIVPE